MSRKPPAAAPAGGGDSRTGDQKEARRPQQARTGSASGKSASGSRGPYSSRSITERRDRLVKAALSQLMRGRASEFTLREVTRQAGVSLSVLYASFGSKEGLVAAAVEAFYRRTVAGQNPAPASVDGMLRQIVEDAKVTVSHRSYVRSLCDLYFLHQSSTLVFDEMNNIARDTFRPWLAEVVVQGDLRESVTPQMAEAILASDRWHAISDWVRGHVPTERFPEATIFRFLVAAAGLTRGATHDLLVAEIPASAMRLRAMGVT